MPPISPAQKPRQHTTWVLVVSVLCALAGVAALAVRDYVYPIPKSFPRTPVRSTVMRSVEYDATSRTLRIEFVNGNEYSYFGVSPAIAHGLISAESKGQYFNMEIKEVYRYQHILRAPPISPTTVGLDGVWSTSTNDKFMLSMNADRLQMRSIDGPTFSSGSCDLALQDGKWHGLFQAVFKGDTLGVRRMSPLTLTAIDSNTITVDTFTIQWNHLGAETSRTPIQFSLVRTQN